MWISCRGPALTLCDAFVNCVSLLPLSCYPHSVIRRSQRSMHVYITISVLIPPKSICVLIFLYLTTTSSFPITLWGLTTHFTGWVHFSTRTTSLDTWLLPSEGPKSTMTSTWRPLQKKNNKKQHSVILRLANQIKLGCIPRETTDICTTNEDFSQFQCTAGSKHFHICFFVAINI